MPRRSGFTLVEILAAMAVLVVLVLLMAHILSDSTGAMNRGNRRMEMSASGRAVLDLVARDLSQALTSSNAVFKIVSGGNHLFGANAYDIASDEIYFVSPGGSVPENPRSARPMAYFVDVMLKRQSSMVKENNLYSLVRYASTNALEQGAWWTNAIPQNLPTVADYIVAFNALAADESGNSENYDSTFNTNRLPLWVDLSLELMAADDARQVATMWDINKDVARDMIDRYTRRYTTRVYFPNRERSRVMP